MIRPTGLLLGLLCAPAALAQGYERPTLGAPASPTIDGAAGDWGPAHLVAAGLANDDPRSLGDAWSMHETPWDLTHLWAAWDDEALYLAWQYVDVTDVIDPNNAGSAGGTAPNQMDLIQWIAFDTQPDAGSALDMWGKNFGEPYWTGADQPDYQIYVASNLWQGYLSEAVDGVFQVDDGGVHYLALEAAGVTIAFGDGVFGGDALPGVDDADQAGAATGDFLERGHDTGRDTFYELRVPLAALGLDRARLEANGLGVMIGQGEGSCLDTLPHDPATLDTLGVSDSNSPLEWGDVDALSVPFARIATAAFGEAGPEPTPDAGVGPVDAGVGPVDAGVTPVADLGGRPVADAGPTPGADQGAVGPPERRDAGRAADLGLDLPEIGDAPSSDGCAAAPGHGSAPTAWWAAAALLALARPRRWPLLRRGRLG